MEEIKIVFDEPNNQSLAIFEDKPIWEWQFDVKDGKWFIMNTGVRPEFGGRGIAKQLVLKIIEEARKINIKIVPICSYAVKVMVGNDEYKDILG